MTALYIALFITFGVLALLFWLGVESLRSLEEETKRLEDIAYGDASLLGRTERSE